VQAVARLHTATKGAIVVDGTDLTAVPAHRGYDGSLKLLTVDARDLAFADAPHGGGLVTDLVTDPADVQQFEVRYDRIGHLAAPIGPSRAMIHQALEMYT
jgi:uncharacterized protein DUF5753